MSSKQFNTVPAGSNPRVRDSRPSRATIPSEDKAERQKAKEEKDARLNARIQAWFDATETTAAQIAEEFKLKLPHARSLLYNAGVRMMHKREPTAYNAWLSHKSREGTLCMLVHWNINLTFLCLNS
jgi:hypothetical protein